MEKIGIFADELNQSQLGHLSRAIDIINGSQNYFSLSNEIQKIILPGDSEIDSITSKIFLEENTTNKFKICITNRPFNDNYFSHDYPPSSIISINDWERGYAPPSLKCYIIYEITQALLAFEGELSYELNHKLSHEPAAGCLMDFCINKTDIKLGMVSGNLCLDCRNSLRQLGTLSEALDAIDRILVYVRAEAIGRPIIIDPNSAFIIMRFTKNDENDNAYLYGIKQGLESVGIKVERADNVVPSSQILDKIKKYIDRCRFIVAKVDENNLNVYFELGLAMGSNKDVLLISEGNVSLHLPTDLKNWNCLTYERGNFKQLKDNIINYYKDHYGLTPKEMAN